MKIYQMTNDELTNGIKVFGEFYTNEGVYPPEQSAFKDLTDEFVRRSKEFEEVDTAQDTKCGCGSTEFESEGNSMVCTGCGIVYNKGGG